MDFKVHWVDDELFFREASRPSKFLKQACKHTSFKVSYEMGDGRSLSYGDVAPWDPRKNTFANLEKSYDN